MKNFPHQINQIPKLVNALIAIDTLINNGDDVYDDGVLGYTLARQSVYTFRGFTIGGDIEERIRQEQDKPASSQGARTCARDLRRLFFLLKFISDSTGSLQITGLGRDIISAGINIEQTDVKILWRRALRDIELYSEDGRLSHPYIILLRLLADFPGIISKRLSLALEAEDDSEEEYSRISGLCSIENWDDVCREIGASDFQISNAVKILPSLARQVEDIRAENDQNFAINNVQEIANTTNATNGTTNTRAPRESRRVNAAGIANVNNQIEEEDTNATNTTDLTEAIRLRRERTNLHHSIVRSFAIILESKGYELYEIPMDCFAVKEDNPISILAEIKTVDGSILDEIKQVRDAFSQLYYYEHFNVSQIIEHTQVKKLVLFSTKISDNNISFLQENNCLVLWTEGNGISGTTEAIEFLNNQNILLTP